MIGAGATSATPICFPSTISSISLNSAHSNYFPRKFVHPLELSSKKHPSCFSTTLQYNKFCFHFSVKASSSVGSAEYTEEPATNVKFQKTLSLPGCSSPLLLLGTGYREKVLAIIGVKVYAAALYINNSILSRLNEIREASLFNSVFQAPMEKSLQIVLVRDVDGKTFWDALNDAISPRIKTPTSVDNSALSTFRSTFEGRPLKKGTLVFLTWPDTSKMLVSISMDGLPTVVDATIESGNVSYALYDVFFGDSPVSPTLKASVAEGLATILK